MTLLDLCTRQPMPEALSMRAAINRTVLASAIYGPGKEGGLRGIAHQVGQRLDMREFISKGFEWGLVEAVHRLDNMVARQDTRGMEGARLIVHPSLKETEPIAFGRVGYATHALLFEDEHCPLGSLFILKPVDVLVNHTEDFSRAQVALRYPEVAGMLTLFEDRPAEGELIQ